MIETKEGCPLSEHNRTLARITYQRFFRRYLRLSGMTGTAQEVRREIWAVYRLETVTIPTNRPSRRQVAPHRLRHQRLIATPVDGGQPPPRA